MTDPGETGFGVTSELLTLNFFSFARQQTVP
jgi:hypothetical protein